MFYSKEITPLPPPPGRFSHGQVVAVEELQPFQEPDLSALGVGSACLAKHSDGIWYTAKITGEWCRSALCWDSGRTVK